MDDLFAKATYMTIIMQINELRAEYRQHQIAELRRRLGTYQAGEFELLTQGGFDVLTPQEEEESADRLYQEPQEHERELDAQANEEDFDYEDVPIFDPPDPPYDPY